MICPLGFCREIMRLRTPVIRFFLLLGLTLGLGTCFASPAVAGSEFSCLSPLAPAEEKTIIAEVEKFYQGLQTLDGGFVQNSFTLGMNQREVSKGKVFFRKPGLMDWWYEEPEKSKQRFVADGKSLWIYQPLVPQVMIGDFDQSFSSDLPVSFLLGIGKMSERFKLISACKTDVGVALKLQPQKQDASLDEFTLLVEAKTRAPLGARLVDAGGNETAIVFSGVHYNAPLEDSHFQFTVPRGVDVIDKRKGATHE